MLFVDVTFAVLWHLSEYIFWSYVKDVLTISELFALIRDVYTNVSIKFFLYLHSYRVRNSILYEDEGRLTRKSVPTYWERLLYLNSVKNNNIKIHKKSFFFGYCKMYSLIIQREAYTMIILFSEVFSLQKFKYLFQFEF